MNRYQDLISRAKTGETILMDGATGTECERRGVPQLKNAWNGGAALSHPEILMGVHEDYIKSGSEIIISNTFANTKHALQDSQQAENFEKYNSEGVRLAIEARKNQSKDVLVAGGISYWTWTGRKPSLKMLKSSVEKQAKIMEKNGADLLILEMMVDIEQMYATLEASKKTKLPVWVGLTCSVDNKGNIFLGERLENNKVLDRLEDAVNAIKNFDIDVICIMHTKIKDTLPCLKELKNCWNGLVGVYPNTSSYNNLKNKDSTEWAFEQVINKEKFIDYAKTWKDFGVNFVGGCCGVNIEHINELAKIIK